MPIPQIFPDTRQGITSLVLLGDLPESVGKPPLTKAIPDSYALRLGMIMLAGRDLPDDGP